MDYGPGVLESRKTDVFFLYVHVQPESSPMGQNDLPTFLWNQRVR